MTDALTRLAAAEAELARAKRAVAEAHCSEVGHDWRHIGGKNCGCDDGGCSEEIVTEPDFLSQTGEAKTKEECRAWFQARAREAEAKGATWHRYSHHEETGTILYEGWLRRPKSEGPLRWQFVSLPLSDKE